MDHHTKLLIALCAPVIVLTALGLISEFFSPTNKWFCRVMGWHKSPKGINFDGASFEGECPRCGKHVKRDSQGNWF
jgi:hypothetical protein